MGFSHSSVSSNFPTTHWSEIQVAGDEKDEMGQAALAALLERYWHPIFYHVQRRTNGNEERAKDLTQSFIEDKFIRQNLCRVARSEKGRFRALILCTLNRFLRDEAKREHSTKRGGRIAHMPLEHARESDLVGGTECGEDYDLAWVRQVLVEALQRMEAACGHNRQGQLWHVFEERLLKPILQGDKPMEYDELMDRFGFHSYAQVTSALSRSKRFFRRFLQQVIGEYERGNQAVQAEIGAFQLVLRRLEMKSRKSGSPRQIEPEKS